MIFFCELQRPFSSRPSEPAGEKYIQFLLYSVLSAGSSSKASDSAGDSVPIIYPDFSAYHRPKPDGCLNLLPVKEKSYRAKKIDCEEI
jgi:hypothetical protein